MILAFHTLPRPMQRPHVPMRPASRGKEGQGHPPHEQLALPGANLLVELERGAVGVLEDAGQHLVAFGSAIGVGAHFGRGQDDFRARVFHALEAVAEILKSGVRFLGLAPRSLADIYADIALIAGAIGASDHGEHIIGSMHREIETVRARHAAGPHPRVFCEEWGKPIIHSQRWVAELVEAAGGCFLGEPGAKTDSECVRRADPEVMVMAWCGAADRVPLEKIVSERGWGETSAGRSRRVYCVRDELLNTPAPTLLDGLRALEAAVHPDLFSQLPAGLRRMAL